MCVIVVRDDDRLRGVDGVQVAISGPSPGTGSTDDQGVAEFASRVPGTYQLRVTVAGSSRKAWQVLDHPEQIAVGAGSVSIAEVVVVPTGTLVLDVRDDKGVPFDAPVQVTIDGPEKSSTARVQRSASFPGRRVGRYCATVQLDASLDAWSPDKAAAVQVPEDGSATIRMVMRPPSWIEIELRDVHGQAIANEAYRIVAPDGRELLGRTDEHGGARIDRVRPGDCIVSFPDRSSHRWPSA